MAALKQLGGSASIVELVEQILQHLNLPDDIIELPHAGRSHRTELEYRLAWVRSNLKAAGILDNSTRGIWSLTPEGAKVEWIDPKWIRAKVREKKRHRRRNDEALAKKHDEQPEQLDWRDEVRELLLKMSPRAFEHLCQRLLREAGFIQVEVTRHSGDEGIDGHGIVRLAGLVSFPVVFQCKRFQSKVTAAIVRDFRGSMSGRTEKGLIITTNGFTRDAIREATREGVPPIDLIDGAALIDLLKELRIGVEVRTEQVEIVEVRKEQFDALEYREASMSKTQ